MKYSIRNELLVVFMTIMTGTILLCWFLNSSFLGKYYLQNKQQVLRKAYSNLNVAIREGSIQSDHFEYDLQRMCGIYNISVIVIDADSKLVQSAGNDSDIMMNYLLDRVFLDNTANYELIEKNENYIMEIAYGERNGMTYIEMWGTLENGNLFMTRSVVESIHESVQISNRFLAYVGILAALVSGGLILIITKRFTTPIMSLTEISKRMANLDFEVHYNGTEKNEIGVLGLHMNQLSDKLENTISELKTANNELQKDIEKKEQIDEMRKEFLSNVSHELKTPIALIMGYAEGLKEEINQDPESRDFYCDVIMDEANKMNIMVKKLLTLNQLEFGNDVVSMERFDIRELIANYISSADILIKQSEAKVIFEETESCFVWGDEFKVEEVFTNYFSNALNHVKNEKEVIISFDRKEDTVRIVVFNTGDPIPEESLPHLYEKFYKVDKARTREYGGSGVGLSIVKAIMDSMHQEYGVINRSDGVEFWFELPVK
ncbi:MAG: two-component sensor histidine kinase [Lachnospiraceae bacterium]|nr:two-component sensor histidine kinase [Lachnospiraceae bacterium]